MTKPEKRKSYFYIGLILLSFIAFFFVAFEGLQERKRMRCVLNKVVSKNIASEILSGNDHLGGKEQEVTVLFADIRGFTRLTEKMPPKEVIELLNQCMTKVSHAVDEHNGVIDKYVGDAAMALFGAPVNPDHSAYNAVISAIEIQRRLKSWNETRKAKGLPLVEMGVGVHIGTMVAGNMGSEDRLNYTVLGANVNLASRLCDAAGPSEILVTEEIVKDPKVHECIAVEALPARHFKGFSDEIPVYRVLW